MDHIRDLTTGSLARHLYRLALPIMGTSFVQMAYSFTDMAWLGRLGSQEIAAVGTVSVFLWIAHSCTYLTKTGSEVLISQSIGRQAYEDARSYASHCTTLSLILGSLVMAIYALLATPLIGLYSLTGAVSDLAHEYLYITLGGLPAVFLSYTLFGIYNALGDSRTPFVILSLGMVSNMILDPLLIHTLGLGVAGAGWATVVSQYAVLALFVYRLRQDRLLGSFSLLSTLRRSYLWHIIRIGLPAATLNVLFAFVAIYMGRLASTVGGHIGVATLTTGGQLEALTWSTAQGATTALSTIVGQNYAAGHHRRVWHAYRLTLAFTLAVGLLGTLYFVFGGEGLFALIVPDPSTYAVGARYLRISGYTQMFMMIELTTQGLLYGLGRSYMPAIVSIVGNYLRIPLALYLVGCGWGLDAIWWAVSISAGLKGVMALGCLLFVRRL